MASQKELLGFVENAKYNVKTLLTEAINNVLYHRVKLIKGKYRGRTAQITSVIVDNNHGLLFLCMVYKKRSTEDFLNDDGASRSYIPVTHFILIEERPVLLV